MNWFFRKPAKIDTGLRVSIALQNIITGKIHQTQCTGIITDCSEEGGCLQLSKLIVNGRHLFFSTLNSERYHFIIIFDLLAQHDQPAEAKAESIWMDSRHNQDKTIFKLGIRFLRKEKKLFKLLRSCNENANTTAGYPELRPQPSE